MRMLIALVVVIYLVGVGFELAPVIKANWSTAPASQLANTIVQALPSALAWPAVVYRTVSGHAGTPG